MPEIDRAVDRLIGEQHYATDQPGQLGYKRVFHHRLDFGEFGALDILGAYRTSPKGGFMEGQTSASITTTTSTSTLPSHSTGAILWNDMFDSPEKARAQLRVAGKAILTALRKAGA